MTAAALFQACMSEAAFCTVGKLRRSHKPHRGRMSSLHNRACCSGAHYIATCTCMTTAAAWQGQHRAICPTWLPEACW